MPNENPVLSARRYLAAARRLNPLWRLLALMLLLLLALLGCEERRRRVLQASAPVVSVAEDGRVYINGREMVIGSLKLETSGADAAGRAASVSSFLSFSSFQCPRRRTERTQGTERMEEAQP